MTETTMETLPFQAETKRLLEIVINSLYTHKEIFLRELISNASDAIDALRFEALTKPDLLEGDDKFKIILEVDTEARTLTVHDDGIGMTRDEVVKNIGTIARSGTSELRQKIKEKGASAAAELIGQFGVGFYSSFMVADKVTLVTRRAGEAGATWWESTGDGTFSIREAAKPLRGTSITLHLKEVGLEKTGIDEDYANRWTLARIVHTHSDFVAHPILFGEVGQKLEETPLNTMKPIWSRPKAEIAATEYNDFYKHLSHDWNDPLEKLVLKAEGTFEYRAILYLPARAPGELFFQGFKYGLQLYSKKVLITEDCEALIPHYLRFVRGIVDAADLPLNISRQMLQQDLHVTQIRKWLTKRVVDKLRDVQEHEPEKYEKIWTEFGRALKEGVPADHENRDRLLPLLRWESSNDPKKLTTLKEYVSRMKEGQDEIYYVSAETRQLAETSPHLESIRAQGYEVLYFLEPVDELVAQSVHEFEEKRVRSAIKGTFQKEESEKALADKQALFGPLLEMLQKALGSVVKRVRLTTRLKESPACVVVDEHELAPHVEKILQRSRGVAALQRRTLELNPDHEIIRLLRDAFATNEEDPRLEDMAQLVLGHALLSEGSEIPEPARFNEGLAALLTRSLSSPA